MKTLESFKIFYDEILQSNSRKYKQEVLRKYKDDEVIKKYLQIALDPYRVYGISTKKLSKQILSASSYVPRSRTVFELFDYLEQHNTGTTAEILECQCFAQCPGIPQQETPRTQLQALQGHCQLIEGTIRAHGRRRQKSQNP